MDRLETLWREIDRRRVESKFDLIRDVILYIDILYPRIVYLYVVTLKEYRRYWTYAPRSVRLLIKILVVITAFVKRFKGTSFIMRHAIVLKVMLFRRILMLL